MLDEMCLKTKGMRIVNGQVLWLVCKNRGWKGVVKQGMTKGVLVHMVGIPFVTITELEFESRSFHW